MQVLKRGTMFAQRARKLWEIYRTHDSLDVIPADVRRGLEQDLFRESLGSGLGAHASVFRNERSTRTRARRTRTEASHGAGVPLLSVHGGTVGA